MEKIRMYQVDAFTERLFSGNPAAVCMMDSWIADDMMQSIAGENNLPETVFIVGKEQDYEIRWFAPTTEVDLCGHATLASAYVLFDILGYAGSVIRFHSLKSGVLSVEKKDGMFFLDFPTDMLSEVTDEQNEMLSKCIGMKPLEAYKGRTDYLVIVANESAVKNLKPDFNATKALNARGLIVSAKGDSVDFVSRFFAPQIGVDEDPVTGSAHTSLIPLWSRKTGKTELVANQLSQRGGQLVCRFKGDRCLIGGKARLFLSGEIYLD